MVVPLSTKLGVGHNREQSIENYYHNMAPDCNDPNYYQAIQDRILNGKDQIIISGVAFSANLPII